MDRDRDAPGLNPEFLVRICHHLKTTLPTPSSGRSACPKSNSPRKLPGMESPNSPVLPMGSVMTRATASAVPGDVFSTCLIWSNRALTVELPLTSPEFLYHLPC